MKSIYGKVLPAPHLDALDARVPRKNPSIVDTPYVEAISITSLYLDKDAPRTWARDKAELVAFGVDGDGPFDEAADNSGMTTRGQQGGVKFANKTGLWRLPHASNDNHKIAAKAA